MQDKQTDGMTAIKVHRVSESNMVSGSNKVSRFKPVFKNNLALWLAIVLLLQPITAFAYLDPTTGSMIISAIVGLIASLALAVKTYWYRFKAFFKGKPSENENKDDSF